MPECNTPQPKRNRSPSGLCTDTADTRNLLTSADSPSSQAYKTHEREFSFEFVHRIAELRKKFPGSPFCPGAVKDYATFLSNSHPYLGSPVSSTATKSSVATNPTDSNLSDSAIEVLKRFPSVIDLSSERVSDNTGAKKVASSFLKEIKRKTEAKELDPKNFDAFKAVLAAEDQWAFSDAENCERIFKNAKLIQKKSYDLLFNEETRLEGLIQLLRFAMTEAKALEAFRLDHYAPQEIFKRFKVFSLSLRKLRAQIAIYNPPKFIIALVELVQSSVSFRLASISQYLVPKDCDIDIFKADLESFLDKGANCWLNFSELLSTSDICNNFPKTWRSISVPRELEDGEEVSHSIVYPIPNLLTPSLTAVIIFMDSILEETPTNNSIV